MIEKAFVQRKNGDWLNENAYALARGLYMKGIEVVPFDFVDLERLSLTRDTLVHGGIYTVKRALQIIGVDEPKACDGMPPAELMPFYGRRVWASNMASVRSRLDNDEKIFVKPLHSQKAFTGHVIGSDLTSLLMISGFEDDFEVMCSEVVEFETEYRGFVNRGELVGLRHYKGDFGKIVDVDVVRSAVKAWAGPVSYSIDFGLRSNGTTSLVEVNDGFALGCYGLPSITYANFVQDRWEEMTK